MKSTIAKLAFYYILLVVIFMSQKPLFMLYNSAAFADASFADYLSVMWNGRPHDQSLAGYLCVIPVLLIIAAQWLNGKWIRVAEISYSAVISLVLSVIFVVDTGLYEYWGTKLDTTPLFYFISSPASAAASVSVWFIIGAILIMIIVAVAYFAVIYFSQRKFTIVPAYKLSSRWKRTGVLVLMLGLLFVSIRGGFSVATMNVSAVYHSPDIKLNHAAVNPAFSFMYAATHESDFGSQFNFLSDEEANARFERMMKADNNLDSIVPILNNHRPDIYLFILEGFSAHLMPSLGGESIAVGLDGIAKGGLLFSNFYASSFRTDRAITAILSGYPGQPTTSVMKYVNKAESLPSISSSLKGQGYDCAYYYGGDANFTNMKAYLISCGFDKIISDVDFPIGDRMSKWGVHDHKVFERCESDYKNHRYDSQHPMFTVVQTSSSHEPYDVPYDNPRFAVPSLNAFAYTDSCVAAFVNRLKDTPNWDNTLVVIVPDHQGSYPKDLRGEQRHHVPLIFAGGALERKGTVDTPASQVDLAATLLAQLGVSHEAFKFSKNVLDKTANRFAVFTNTSTLGMVTVTDTIVYSLDDNRLLSPQSTTATQHLNDAKAFLQVLYDDLDKR